MTAKQVVQQFSKQHHLGVHIQTHSLTTLRTAISELKLSKSVAAKSYDTRVYLINLDVLANTK